MASLDYIDIPPSATRLRAGTSSDFLPPANDIRPATKIFTHLPSPSPPSSPPRRRNSAAFLSPSTSPTFSLLPQLLFSSTLPPEAPAAPLSISTTPNPRKKVDRGPPLLLTSRDPLSLPTTTNSFRRFVAKSGPIFWLQDRVEEIIMWRSGWTVTSLWMAGYALICYFPRLILLIPHMAVISIILASYPYPPPSPLPLLQPPSLCSSSDPTSPSTLSPIISPQTTPSQQPQQHLTEGTIDWQANLQAIQNLMGFVSDVYDLVQPHTRHLSLSSSVPPRSPYTPYILTLLLITLPPLVVLVSLPSFPIRAICLFLGLAPLAGTHPRIRIIVALLPVLGHQIWEWYAGVKLANYLNRIRGRGMYTDDGRERKRLVPILSVVERLMDDDRLSDGCWRAEMREVELWENERLGPGASPTDSPNTHAQSQHHGWSKLHLQPGERRAWTRGQDGWSPVAGSGGGEGSGEVSSNLMFALAPGWAFVETEDWRKDRAASWTKLGGDEDGWVYTNDAWADPQPFPVPVPRETGTSVTRRRRWVRRVWYDPARDT